LLISGNSGYLSLLEKVVNVFKRTAIVSAKISQQSMRMTLDLLWQAMLQSAHLPARAAKLSYRWNTVQRIVSDFLELRLLREMQSRAACVHVPSEQSTRGLRRSAARFLSAAFDTRIASFELAGLNVEGLFADRRVGALEKSSKRFATSLASLEHSLPNEEKGRARGAVGQDGSSRVMSFTAVQAHDPSKLHLAAYPRYVMRRRAP
jgi:hypothetical protein